MPTYEFVCRNCSHRFSVFTTVQGRSAVRCPACEGSDLQQLFTGVMFFKKGGGNGAGSTAGASCTRTSCSGCPGC